MIFKRIQINKENNVYLDCYLHENVPQWDYVNTRPAVVVCPGGGYSMVSPREADPIAQKFTAAGYHSFVLYYSIEENAAFPQPLIDLSIAMKIIRENAKEWSLCEDKIAVCGFSAGGHLTASLGTLWNNPEVKEQADCPNGENKPNALILGYPVITTRSWMVNAIDRLVGDRDRQSTLKLLDCSLNVGQHTPPSFLVHTFWDNVVSVEESMCFADALEKNNIPFELHIFPNGAHGLSLGNEETSDHFDPSFSKWVGLCLIWLKRVFENNEKHNPEARARQIKA